MESGADQITVWTLFLEADPVVKGVMLILAVASIWSWAIAVDKWIMNHRRELINIQNDCTLGA